VNLSVLKQLNPEEIEVEIQLVKPSQAADGTESEGSALKERMRKLE